MNKTLVAATHNKGKLNEFARILKAKGISVAAPPDAAVLNGVIEDGETFAENALIKARAVFSETGLPTMADDSGLCIDALSGRPGVYSARYLGEHTHYTVKNAAIIKELEGIPEKERTARFECAVALVTAQGEYVFKGTLKGRIGHEPRGENGFGYDPIFYVGEKSVAEMPDGQKDEISHRGRALRAMLSELDSIL